MCTCVSLRVDVGVWVESWAIPIFILRRFTTCRGCTHDAQPHALPHTDMRARAHTNAHTHTRACARACTESQGHTQMKAQIDVGVDAFSAKVKLSYGPSSRTMCVLSVYLCPPSMTGGASAVCASYAERVGATPHSSPPTHCVYARVCVHIFVRV